MSTISVIGYHGRYKPDQTPVLTVPIYAIDGILCDEHGDTGENVRVDSIDWNLVAGTRVEPFPHVPGSLFLLTDLLEEYLPHEEGLNRVREIRNVAIDLVTLALRRTEVRPEDEKNAWWLFRAAQDDADRIVAVAGLRRAGSSHWLSLFIACFPEVVRR